MCIAIIISLIIGAVIEVQKGLIETNLAHRKPDDDFLELFVDVIGDHWCSLATLLSINPSDVGDSFRERKGTSSTQKVAIKSRGYLWSVQT